MTVFPDPAKQTERKKRQLFVDWYLVMNIQVKELSADGSSISPSPINVIQAKSMVQVCVTVYFIALSSLLVRDGVLARFVATDGGITRVYPKRYLSRSSWRGRVI